MKKFFILALSLFLTVNQGMAHVTDRIDDLNQNLDKARRHDCFPSTKTIKTMTQMDNYMMGNTFGISTTHFMTPKERDVLWSSILNMHLHDRHKDIGVLFNKKDNKSCHYGHFLALFVMHSVAKFVAHNRGIYCASDDLLKHYFVKKIKENLSLLTDTHFKIYMENQAHKNFYVLEALGKNYLTFIYDQSIPYVYKDIKDPWQVMCYQMLGYFKSINDKNDRHFLLKYNNKLKVFAVYDPHYIWEEKLEKDPLLSYCRPVSCRVNKYVVIKSSTDSQPVYNAFLESKYSQKIVFQEPDLPHSNQEINLGGQLVKRVSYRFKTGKSTNPQFHMKNIFNFKGNPLQEYLESVNMTEQEFMTILMNTGLF